MGTIMHLVESLDGYDAFVIDLDGVIYLRHEPVAGAKEFVAALEENGRDFMFLTNNSSRTRGNYVERLHGFGIDVTEDRIMTSAHATSLYLQEKHPGSRVFAVGEEGLRRELQGCGIEIVEDGPVEFVVAGIDLQFTYERLRKASSLIRSGAKFVSTNRDATYPTERGLFPGAGSIVSAIQTASGRRPINIGKPSRRIFDLCLKSLGIPPGRTASIGDRYETDILGGIRAGMGTVMVLSGVTRADEVRLFKDQPDLVVESVGDLVH